MILITETDITSLGWQPEYKRESDKSNYSQTFKSNGSVYNLFICVNNGIIAEVFLLIKIGGNFGSEIISKTNVNTKQSLEQLMYLLNINQ